MRRLGQKIVWYFMLAGFFLPCLLFSVILIGHVRVGGSLAWILMIPWPTFPLIMSAEAGGGAAGGLLAFLQSALVNAWVYGAVGGIVAISYRRFFLRTEI